MESDDLQTFIHDVGLLIGGSDDQYEITKRVAQRLSVLLTGGYRLPPEFIRPSPVRHLTYPLYIAPDNSWSLASVVWNVGQRTPVHGHETWGVVGIYSGAEREIRYVKPPASATGQALTPAGEHVWERGQVTVCCTADDDVHAVAAVGEERPPSASRLRRQHRHHQPAIVRSSHRSNPMVRLRLGPPDRRRQPASRARRRLRIRRRCNRCQPSGVDRRT